MVNLKQIVAFLQQRLDNGQLTLSKTDILSILQMLDITPQQLDEYFKLKGEATDLPLVYQNKENGTLFCVNHLFDNNKHMDLIGVVFDPERRLVFCLQPVYIEAMKKTLSWGLLSSFTTKTLSEYVAKVFNSLETPHVMAKEDAGYLTGCREFWNILDFLRTNNIPLPPLKDGEDFHWIHNVFCLSNDWHYPNVQFFNGPIFVVGTLPLTPEEQQEQATQRSVV